MVPAEPPRLKDAHERTWRAATPADTEALGARFALALPKRAEALRVVYLTGDLGAGKTTFARGFLRAAGVSDTVRSPTYTLLERYETSALTLVHLDLYRLQDPAELEPLGLRDLALPAHLWLIEWPERGTGWLPPPDLTLVFSVAEDAHRIEARAPSPAGREWLEAINA